MEPKENELFKAIGVPLSIAAYLTFCGGLRLYGYYSVFDIELSSRMSLASLPFASIPILYTFVTTLVLLIIAAIIYLQFINIISRIKKVDGDTLVTSLSDIQTMWITILFLGIGIAVMLLSKEPQDQWHRASLVFTCYVGVMLSSTHLTFLSPYVAKRPYQIIIAMQIITLPIWGLSNSKREGYNVLNGVKYNRLDAIKFKSTVDSINFVGMKLLGKEGGDYIILSSDNKNIFYIQSDDVILIKTTQIDTTISTSHTRVVKPYDTFKIRTPHKETINRDTIIQKK